MIRFLSGSGVLFVIVMIDGSANQIPVSDLRLALDYGCKVIDVICERIETLTEMINPSKLQLPKLPKISTEKDSELKA